MQFAYRFQNKGTLNCISSFHILHLFDIMYLLTYYINNNKMSRSFSKKFFPDRYRLAGRFKAIRNERARFYTLAACKINHQILHMIAV